MAPRAGDRGLSVAVVGGCAPQIFSSFFPLSTYTPAHIGVVLIVLCPHSLPPPPPFG